MTRPSDLSSTNGQVPLTNGEVPPHIVAEPEIEAPFPLPPGYLVHLPRRGRLFTRWSEPPRGRPTVVLLHGWMATADLNWFACYEPLAEHFGVIAPDHRGHGRGIRSRRWVRLADCADDVAELIETLGLGPVIAVGYSMGGPIAQLLWHRHRELVRGLVLCATARNFRGHPRDRILFALLEAAAGGMRTMPEPLRDSLRRRIPLVSSRESRTRDWARSQIARHDWRMVLEAGVSLGRFSSHEWVSFVDVPTAVVITERDRLVPPRRQVKLAAAIPGSTVHRVPGDHLVCATSPELFVPALLEACLLVADRSRA
ncbi:MAG: hypothetical protein KatS3mg008_0984 [Acidimicrobiales bacterium]|nr:MAG: hypothetical protein KatS3mg008_0984 [Acidimicrobiales bacterium]